MKTIIAALLALGFVIPAISTTVGASKKRQPKVTGQGFHKRQGGYWIGTGKHGERIRSRQHRIYKTGRR